MRPLLVPLDRAVQSGELCLLTAPSSAVNYFHPSVWMTSSSSEHMERSWQAVLSTFTDHFMLIAFLSGCFPMCAGGPIIYQRKYSRSLLQPDFLGGERVPFRQFIPIRSAGLIKEILCDPPCP